MSLPSQSIQSPKPVDPPRSAVRSQALRTRCGFGARSCRAGRSPFQFHVDFEFVLFLGVEELEGDRIGRLDQNLLLVSWQDLGEIDRTPTQTFPDRKSTRLNSSH